jgi:hypothetical protein
MAVRKMAGGLLLAGLVLGGMMMWLLRGLLPGGSGLLPGEKGEGNGNGPPAAAAAPENGQPEIPEKLPVTPSPLVVQVLIDDRQYLVRTNPVEDAEAKYAPKSLEEIVALVATTKGDGDGVRVRVSRKGSARTTAENALRDRLREAGIGEEAQRWQEDLVP